MKPVCGTCGHTPHYETVGNNIIFSPKCPKCGNTVYPDFLLPTKKEGKK